MSGFTRSNKISGVYWIREPIENLKLKTRHVPPEVRQMGYEPGEAMNTSTEIYGYIGHCPAMPCRSKEPIHTSLEGYRKIKVKPHQVIALPKFEEFTDDARPQRLADSHQIEEYEFVWQEKVFSQWEVQHYANRHNCVTDHQLVYHERVTSSAPSLASKVFTYVNEDGFDSEFLQRQGKTFNRMSSIGALTSCFSQLQISGNQESTEDIAGNGSRAGDSEEGEWIAMHVMMDGTDGDDEIQVLIKKEALLVSVFWNPQRRCLILSPDKNCLDWNPYAVEAGGVRWPHVYSFGCNFDEPAEEVLDAERKLRELLKKLQRKWYRKNRKVLEFEQPPFNVQRHHVSVEILTAERFENDNLHVDYQIWCGKEKIIHRRTQVAKVMISDGISVANFAHITRFPVDFDLKRTDNFAACAQSLRLYAEVISEDWWGRLRTEGYGFSVLPLSAPGWRSVTMRCLRPEERSKVLADSRRFFLGGCHLLEDITWLGTPNGIQGQILNKIGMKTVPSGDVRLRVSSVCQSQNLELPRPKGEARSSTSTLIQSVTTVLEQYNKARERLIASRMDLNLDFNNKD